MTLLNLKFNEPQQREVVYKVILLEVLRHLPNLDMTNNTSIFQIPIISYIHIIKSYLRLRVGLHDFI